MMSSFVKSSSGAVLAAFLSCAAPAPAEDTLRAGLLELRFDADKGIATVRPLMPGSDIESGTLAVGVLEGPQKAVARLNKNLRIRHELEARGRHFRL